MTVVLDSWAVMRLLEGSEPTATKVQSAIDEGAAVMNWVNLGEVYYVLTRVIGADVALTTIRDLENALTTVTPDSALILEAARIKADHAMSYADAFAAATAIRFDAPLWTGDPELFVSGAQWQSIDPSRTRS